MAKKKAPEKKPKKIKKRQPALFDDDDGGGAGWLLTFADLMSLLMAFFVLLFAMSEVDKDKFEQLGISLSASLGNKHIQKPEGGLGDQEKHAKPVPIVIPESKDTKEKINKLVQHKLVEIQKKKDHAEQKKKDQDQKHLQDNLNKLRQSLKDQIIKKKIQIKGDGKRIVISLQQADAFGSGSDELIPEAHATIKMLTKTLKDMPGTVIVAGHTDDRPITNLQHRSNWELSAGRAASVIHEMQKNNFDKKRFILRAYGSTKPLAPNDTDENRAKNRRVEIIIDQTTIGDTNKANEEAQKTVSIIQIKDNAKGGDSKT